MPVSTAISPRDALLDPETRYAAYNPFTGTAAVLQGRETMDISVPGENDFQMGLFVPIVNGRAILGLKEKYICLPQ